MLSEEGHKRVILYPGFRKACLHRGRHTVSGKKAQKIREEIVCVHLLLARHWVRRTFTGVSLAKACPNTSGRRSVQKFNFGDEPSIPSHEGLLLNRKSRIQCPCFGTLLRRALGQIDVHYGISFLDTL